MQDTELVAQTRPPEPIAGAFLAGNEFDLENLLDLMFACHLLVDDPEREDYIWHQSDIAWPIFSLYDKGEVPAILKNLAPTWEDAILLSESWLEQFPHECGEFEWWALRRDEWDNPSICSFFREMLKDRVLRASSYMTRP